MRTIDLHEEKILKELIRDPRISDNAMARRTKIPVTTVNRKRKQMEKEGILSYFVHVSENVRNDTSKVRQLYIIKFKEGITIQNYLEKVRNNMVFRSENAQYHVASYVGEKDGHFALVVLVEAETEAELVEVFHGNIVKGIRARHGDDCIVEIFTTKIIFPIRLHHNYLPLFNMQEGKIRDDWKTEWIHVPIKTRNSK